MKQIIFLIALGLLQLAGRAQTTASYKTQQQDVASWKLWLLDNPQQLVCQAPPDKAKSGQELQAIKKAMKQTDKIKQDQIVYWSAGAPSYRWNQMAPEIGIKR
jgi:hypothetical protein